MVLELLEVQRLAQGQLGEQALAVAQVGFGIVAALDVGPQIAGKLDRAADGLKEGRRGPFAVGLANRVFGTAGQAASGALGEITADFDANGNRLPDEQRLTRLGRFLRDSSLAELPELFHVLRGEMSLVGPRPLLMQYLSRYSPEQARRHDVLPGITGWAQVNGRNALTWQDKFRLDVWYVDHWSLGLDIRILLLTLWKVIAREGISQPGHATAEEFMGNNDEIGSSITNPESQTANIPREDNP